MDIYVHGAIFGEHVADAAWSNILSLDEALHHKNCNDISLIGVKATELIAVKNLIVHDGTTLPNYLAYTASITFMVYMNTTSDSIKDTIKSITSCRPSMAHIEPEACSYRIEGRYPATQR